MLRSSIASLEQAQTPEQMRKSLEAVANYARAAKARTAQAYQNDYGVAPVMVEQPKAQPKVIDFMGLR